MSALHTFNNWSFFNQSDFQKISLERTAIKINKTISKILGSTSITEQKKHDKELQLLLNTTSNKIIIFLKNIMGNNISVEEISKNENTFKHLFQIYLSLEQHMLITTNIELATNTSINKLKQYNIKQTLCDIIKIKQSINNRFVTTINTDKDIYMLLSKHQQTRHLKGLCHEITERISKCSINETDALILLSIIIPNNFTQSMLDRYIHNESINKDLQN